MELTQDEPWPVRRGNHAACCLNYGEDHPQLLVSGGLDNELKVLGDMWILDVNSRKWEKVICLFVHAVSLLGKIVCMIYT